MNVKASNGCLTERFKNRLIAAEFEMRSRCRRAVARKERQFGRSELGRLGRQVRLLRQQSSLTRAQLAASSGLSAQSIREIEAGRSSPSLATVVAISEALEITLDELVSAARRAVPVIHTPAASVSTQPNSDLTRDLPQPNMRARIIRISSKSKHRHPEQDGSEHAFCFVLEGSVSVAFGQGAATRLRQGDSFHTAAGIVPRLTSSGAEPARLLLVTSPARTGIDRQIKTMDETNGPNR